MSLLDEIVEIAVPAVIEVAEEHQAAAVVHESPMGEVHGAHAAEIPVGRNDAEHQSQTQMAGPEQSAAQHPRFDGSRSSRRVIFRSSRGSTGGLSWWESRRSNQRSHMKSAAGENATAEYDPTKTARTVRHQWLLVLAIAPETARP